MNTVPNFDLMYYVEFSFKLQYFNFNILLKAISVFQSLVFTVKSSVVQTWRQNLPGAQVAAQVALWFDHRQSREFYIHFFFILFIEGHWIQRHVGYTVT